LESPSSGAPLDLGRPLPGGPPATVEVTARRGPSGGVVLSDHDAQDPARSGWAVRALADGRLVAATFDGRGGSTTATSAAGTWPQGTWAHLAVVADGGGLGVFMDGVEVARAAGPIRLAASSSTAWVGAGRGAPELPVTVDALRISPAARYP
jgi:hypothetical protein